MLTYYDSLMETTNYMCTRDKYYKAVCEMTVQTSGHIRLGLCYTNNLCHSDRTM